MTWAFIAEAFHGGFPILQLRKGSDYVLLQGRDAAFMERLRALAQEALTWPFLQACHMSMSNAGSAKHVQTLRHGSTRCVLFLSTTLWTWGLGLFWGLSLRVSCVSCSTL